MGYRLPRPEVAAEGRVGRRRQSLHPRAWRWEHIPLRLRTTVAVEPSEAVALTGGPVHPGRLTLLADFGLPDDADKRVGRGLPVGVSVCSHCEHVALSLPPTLDRPDGRRGPGNSRSPSTHMASTRRPAMAGTRAQQRLGPVVPPPSAPSGWYQNPSGPGVTGGKHVHLLRAALGRLYARAVLSEVLKRPDVGGPRRG